MVPVTFDHLARLTTPLGLFEHALFTSARPEHGYCLDDAARGLVVTTREAEPSSQAQGLTRTYLRFVLHAQDRAGRFHNRRDRHGSWTDVPSLEDHWGRAVWALGTAAAEGNDAETRDAALAGAVLGLRNRSPWNRATAYAALGAFEVLRVRPGNPEALALLGDARAQLDRHGSDSSWPWPEPRLTYANAVLPEALLVIGTALADDGVRERGLTLLAWLLERETRGRHLSVTPAGGWQPADVRPGFDQQPIEVAALAEACWRALQLTGDPQWLTGVVRAVAWFLGANDSGVALYDATTGGGRDGLQEQGANENQGAESTLAALSTLQLGRRAALEPVR